MRISTQQIYNSAVTQMQKGQTNLAQLQERISTGKELLRPSDDPIAAAQILKLEREVARTEKYQENIDASERRLSLEEITLDQINTATDRLKELTIQAGNGVLTDEDRASIAVEVRQIQDQVLGLMNTQDAQGEYLFSGNQGHTQPFVRDPQTQAFEYQGDDGQRFIQVAPKLRVASTDSGRDAFVVVPLQVQAVGDSSSLDTLIDDSLVVEDESAYRIFSEQNPEVFLNVSSGTWTLEDGSGTPLNDSGGNTLTGSAASNPTTITVEGLEFQITGEDASIELQTEPRHTILQTAENLINALETPVTDSSTQQTLENRLNITLEELDTVQQGNIQLRTQLGARINSLETAREVNADFKLFTESALSQLQDLDYSEAIADFSLQEMALQASQATFAKVNNLSLFNFL